MLVDGIDGSVTSRSLGRDLEHLVADIGPGGHARRSGSNSFRTKVPTLTAEHGPCTNRVIGDVTGRLGPARNQRCTRRAAGQPG